MLELLHDGQPQVRPERGGPVKRAAQIIAALAGLVVVIVGTALLTLWAAGAFDVAVPGKPAAATPQAVPASTKHEVVVSVAGAPGTQFRVRGEVFGDTGPIDLPAAGHDSAHFSTAKPAEQIDLTVYVAAPIGDKTANCAITYDGHVIAQADRVPLEDTNTLACRVRFA
ncbi:hypothetical protein AB0383_48805 [Amycolatopsis sp. NPDC051373]|uniref:hypothetical protein n=1 Tax=Amycolatopsis sp. NPDC051373 TaxID=3155801 RepID=UPI00344DAE98